MGNPSQNGFELGRQLHREVDPAHPEESRGIVSKMRALFPGPAATTDDLWSLVLAQERLNDEHFDRLARRFAESIMCDNMLFSLTAQIAKDLARDGKKLRNILQGVAQGHCRPA